jgi:hypothetical protein
MNPFAVRLHHRQVRGIHFAGNIELRQSPIPLTMHREQLKEKDAELGIRRIGTYLLRQSGQRFVEFTIADQLFGGRSGHVISRDQSWPRFAL